MSKNHINYLKFDTDKLSVCSGIFIPVLIETVLSSFYNVVDMMMVGRDSTAGLAAIGLTSSPLSVFLAFFQAINVGTTTLVAWKVGAKRKKEAQDIMGISLIMNLVSGIVMTVLGMAFSKPIVHFMGGEPEVEILAIDYYNILVVGTTFQALTYSVTASMRGAGYSKVPMVYNTVSNLLNVFGNYILIYGKLGFSPMGVLGAGYSTLISRMICCILALAYQFFSRRSEYSFRHMEGKFVFSWKGVIQILRIGIPSALENLVMQCGSMIYVKIVASLGTVQYSAHQICSSLNSITSSPSTAFSVTANTVVGQHIGANEIEESKKFKQFLVRCALIVAIVMAVVVNVFSKQIVGLYSTDTVVTDAAKVIFTIVSIQYLTLYTNTTISGAIRGAGDTKFAMWLSALSFFLFRIPVTYLLGIKLGFGLQGIWISLLLHSWLNFFALSERYRSGKWLETYKKVNK